MTSMPITFTVRLLSSSLVFVGGFVCERLTSGVPVLVCHSHSRMLIRIRACVNRSTTHTCPPAPRLIACHDWHTRVVAQCSPPSLSPQLAHVFASMIPSRPTSPLPIRFVFHLRPKHVSHTLVFHVKHIRTPVRLPPPLLPTSRSPVLPHTPLPQLLYVDLRHFHRQPNQFHPTPLQGPHRAFRGFHIENGSHIGHIHCDVTHDSPEKRLERWTKTLLALPSGFHPLRGARVSRPDPSGGRPRVKPVPVFLSFSLSCR